LGVWFFAKVTIFWGRKNHVLPYLDNGAFTSTKIGHNLKRIYFGVWPLAKCGSFLLWLIASPPTWQNWKEKP
jgi:hypothetical protein